MMNAPLPKNRQDCIEQIRAAFSACVRPERNTLVSWGGLDGPYAEKNWASLSSEQVEHMEQFNSFLAEDLSYMSSRGLRYYLPAIMILFLRRPEVVHPDGVWPMISRIEGIFGCRPKSIKKADVLESYRPIRLTDEQRDAIRNWCGQILTIIKKFQLGFTEQEYRDRLRRLRKVIRMKAPLEDYDANMFQSKTRAEPAAGGYSPEDGRKTSA